MTTSLTSLKRKGKRYLPTNILLLNNSYCRRTRFCFRVVARDNRFLRCLTFMHYSCHVIVCMSCKICPQIHQIGTRYYYDNSHILVLFSNNNYIFLTSKNYFTSKVTTINSIIFEIMCSQYRFLRTNNFREMIIISDVQIYIIITFGNTFTEVLRSYSTRVFFYLNK